MQQSQLLAKECFVCLCSRQFSSLSDPFGPRQYVDSGVRIA